MELTVTPRALRAVCSRGQSSLWVMMILVFAAGREFVCVPNSEQGNGELRISTLILQALLFLLKHNLLGTIIIIFSHPPLRWLKK